MHEIITIKVIIRIVGIIRGRVLLDEIYFNINKKTCKFATLIRFGHEGLSHFRCHT